MNQGFWLFGENLMAPPTGNTVAYKVVTYFILFHNAAALNDSDESKIDTKVECNLPAWPQLFMGGIGYFMSSLKYKLLHYMHLRDH